MVASSVPELFAAIRRRERALHRLGSVYREPEPWQALKLFVLAAAPFVVSGATCRRRRRRRLRAANGRELACHGRRFAVRAGRCRAGSDRRGRAHSRKAPRFSPQGIRLFGPGVSPQAADARLNDCKESMMKIQQLGTCLVVAAAALGLAACTTPNDPYRTTYPDSTTYPSQSRPGRGALRVCRVDGDGRARAAHDGHGVGAIGGAIAGGVSATRSAAAAGAPLQRSAAPWSAASSGTRSSST